MVVVVTVMLADVVAVVVECFVVLVVISLVTGWAVAV